MTPDKIYLPNGKEAVQNGLYKTWFDTDEHDMPYAEYIRKKALIEWLKKEIAFYPDEVYSNDHYDDGAKEALQGVIDKLNSM